MTIKVLYVDADVVAVNKPAGMPSHPLSRFDGNTAYELVIQLYPEIAQASDNEREGGLCHRLDNDTSGILVFARNRQTYQMLRQAFSVGSIKKSYTALVEGRLEHPLTINHPIAHHKSNTKKMVAVKPGVSYYRGKPQSAVTTLTPCGSRTDATRVQVTIQGGRRHQIRVHCASEGFPLVGDTLYGAQANPNFVGQALHAGHLVLPDGTAIDAPVPF